MIREKALLDAIKSTINDQAKALGLRVDQVLEKIEDQQSVIRAAHLHGEERRAWAVRRRQEVLRNTQDWLSRTTRGA